MAGGSSGYLDSVWSREGQLQPQSTLEGFPGDGPLAFDVLQGFQRVEEVLSVFLCPKPVELTLQLRIFQGMRPDPVFCT